MRLYLTSLSATAIWPKDTPKARHHTSRLLMSNTVGLSSGSSNTMSSLGRNLCRLTWGSRLDLRRKILRHNQEKYLDTIKLDNWHLTQDTAASAVMILNDDFHLKATDTIKEELFKIFAINSFIFCHNKIVLSMSLFDYD